MVYLANEYYEKNLIVNRIKTVAKGRKSEHFAIHVNRVDDKRVNGWIGITENMTLMNDVTHEIVNWDYIKDDGTYYHIVFDRPVRDNFTEVPKITAHIVHEYF